MNMKPKSFIKYQLHICILLIIHAETSVSSKKGKEKKKLKVDEALAKKKKKTDETQGTLGNSSLIMHEAFSNFQNLKQSVDPDHTHTSSSSSSSSPSARMAF